MFLIKREVTVQPTAYETVTSSEAVSQGQGKGYENAINSLCISTHLEPWTGYVR